MMSFIAHIIYLGILIIVRHFFGMEITVLVALTAISVDITAVRNKICPSV